MIGFIALLLLSDWMHKTVVTKLHVPATVMAWILTGLFLAGLGALGYLVARLLQRPKR